MIFGPVVEALWWLFKMPIEGGGGVNREFLDWLSRARQPERPFFAFLNFYDAHYPYQLPATGIHRFGGEPTQRSRRDLIRRLAVHDGSRRPHVSRSRSARDAYDDCVADLDEQLGRLIDELDRRGVLEQTWVIITSDHGESFGEHAGVFWHGTSLYETELHVPLVIIPPTADREVIEASRHRDGEPAGPGGDDRRCLGPGGRFPVSREFAGPVLDGDAAT